jgi:DNA-binding beta-propeller fold protein YncE
MKAIKVVTIFLVFVFSATVFFPRHKLPVQAEEKNPLKIEKVIGLSKIPGSFRNGSGVAVSKDGTIFIADLGESQIEVYDSSFKFLRCFGSIGSGDGQFQYIQQIRFDQDENLYVLDYFLCRIQVFSKDGKLIRQLGEKGDQPSQLQFPNDFDFLNANEIVIVDSSTNFDRETKKSLKVFSIDGNFIRSFFKEEKYTSQKVSYHSLMIDQKGYVYIDSLDYDSFKSGYLKFSQDGAFVCDYIEEGEQEKHITNYLGCKSMEGNYLYLNDGNAIKKYEILEDPKMPVQFVETIINATEEATDKSNIMDPSALLYYLNKIYFLDWSLNRLTVYGDKKEVLGIIQSSIMEDGYMYINNETPKEILSTPRGITIGPDKNFYVASNEYNKVSIFDSTWNEIKSIGKPMVGEKKVLGEMNMPFDIVFDSMGYLFISDRYTDSLEIYTKDLIPYLSFPLEQGTPLGLAINSQGYLVVCLSSYPNDKIGIFDISKIADKKITKKKIYTLDVDGYKYDIVDVVIDDEDNMIVSLNYSNEIIWVSMDGKVIQRIQDINSARGLLRDGAGNIYVTKPDNQSIQKLSPKGETIWESNLGWYSLSYMTMDQNGKLYITDSLHNIILVVSDETAIPPKPLEPKPLQTEAMFRFKMNQETITEEDTITLLIMADKLERCSILDLAIQFPEDLLSYQSAKLGSLFEDSDFRITSKTSNDGILSIYLKSSQGKAVNNSGKLLEIKFVASHAGTGVIDFSKISIKNTLGSEVLFKGKESLNLTILPKDRLVIKLVIGSKVIIVKDKQGILDSEPYIDISSGRTMVPLRAIGEALGARIDYDVADRSITVYVGETTIKLWIGKPKAVVNGKEVSIDEQIPLSPVIVKGRTFLPLRFIAETFGFKVDWDPKTLGITLTFPNPDKK